MKEFLQVWNIMKDDIGRQKYVGTDGSRFYAAGPWRRYVPTGPFRWCPALRIRRIRRLRKCGIFRDFDGDALPEFAEFNLIYGQNWSGKTTLSRVLRSLELQEVPDGEVLISTDGSGNIRGDNFPNTTIRSACSTATSCETTSSRSRGRTYPQS